jgi:hypothetical protein
MHNIANWLAGPSVTDRRSTDALPRLSAVDLSGCGHRVSSYTFSASGSSQYRSRWNAYVGSPTR